ncbi:MAG: hypothetical protein ACYC5N_10075, partial [Endomicrobiales bacterium]
GAKESDKKVIVDPFGGRYGLVALANEWMAVLLRSEECKGMGSSEIVKKALEDITSGAVTPEEVHKAAARVKAAPQTEEEKAKEKRAE